MTDLMGLPSLKEELDRKVFDTIEWLFTGLNNGMLSEEQFSTGIDTLFMAAAGLVDEGFVQLITEAQSMSASKHSKRRLFHAPSEDEIVVVSWSPGQDKVIISKHVCGCAISGKTVDFVSPKDAAEYMRTVGSQMEDMGWIEL